MLLGSEWVLFLLLGLSVVSVAVMVERAIFLRARGDADAFARELEALLKGGDLTGARKALVGRTAPAAMVAAAGLSHYDRGSESVGAAMASAKARLRIDMEKNLGVLGTLGNNAPFIGLFGTVLGIIKAFADLSRNSAGGAGAVMAGISEALVATAVGLMVAIPAVIAFNYFQAKVRKTISGVDSIAHMVLATFPGESDAAGAPVRAEAKG
ncbi:MAG TPA: MotA/TolQ/ExbB proton channel family protein [Polyangia bacterium]|jgi:biopolymer transport protein ExbB/TolQ